MKQRIDELEKEVSSLLKGVKTKDELLSLRVRYLGRKGKISILIKALGQIACLEERRRTGEAVNRLKRKIEEEIERLLCDFEERDRKESLLRDRIDITLPGRYIPPGRLHPVTQVMDEIVDIFSGLGFDIAQGPEVEEDYYNFEALNIPQDHPARDMQDTFYISDRVLLRTHTSPVQIRVMERSTPPLSVIAPGTVYRRDSDLTHTPMFHQVEGFMVDRCITFGDLKGVLTHFLHSLFGKDTPIRFRPSFFPFTEPSAEVDIGCVICSGRGCRVCKGSGWLEILGCGMIHPQVFRYVNYDPEEFTGFAFGLGIERIAMLKFGIDDIRLFFENDVRFLRQF